MPNKIPRPHKQDDKPKPPPPPPPKPPEPPRPPKPSPPPPPPIPPVKKLLGSYGNESIDQWDRSFIGAVNKLEDAIGIELDPHILKAMMDVESGGDGNYPADRCRGSDGYDNVPACGPMQIKFKYHAWRCPSCDTRIVQGQIELAAFIIGMDMKERNHDAYQAITSVYFPGADVNGTTQAGYLKRVRDLVAIMRSGRPPEPGPDRPRSVDPLDVITGGVSTAVSFPFLGWNETGAYYAYVIGHGGLDAHQHSGIDVLLPMYTPLYTPLPGKVICVGQAGQVMWGQGCGAFNDLIGGGIGNVTILFDGGVYKMTLGHCNSSLVDVGERVQANQIVAKSGGMNVPHVHIDISTNVNGSYWLLDPVPALKKAMGNG